MGAHDAAVHAEVGWRWPGGIMTIAYLGIGAALLVQPERFDRTPSYANLLLVLPAPVWSALYLLVALLLLAYLWAVAWRPYAILTHTLAIALTALWLAAFVVRYATDDSTTLVNVVSWAVYLALLIWSATLVDESTRIRVAAADPE